MSTLSLWARRDPFAEFDGLFRRYAEPVARQGFVPAAEVERDGEDAVVRLELPGLDGGEGRHRRDRRRQARGAR